MAAAGAAAGAAAAAAAQSARMQRLPPGWSQSRIGDMVEDHIEQGLPEDAREFTYVDISAVDNQLKEIIGPKVLSTAQAPGRARQRIQGDDVLVSTTRPNLNAVALVPERLDGAIASTGFAVLRPVLLDSRWLFAVVQSGDFVKEMSALVKGALYPAIRPSHVHDYLMPVPPLAEQKRITSRLAKSLKRARNIGEALAELPALIQQYRAEVLEAACTGRLVPTEAKLARRQEPPPLHPHPPRPTWLQPTNHPLQQNPPPTTVKRPVTPTFLSARSVPLPPRSPTKPDSPRRGPMKAGLPRRSPTKPGLPRRSQT